MKLIIKVKEQSKTSLKGPLQLIETFNHQGIPEKDRAITFKAVGVFILLFKSLPAISWSYHG